MADSATVFGSRSLFHQQWLTFLNAVGNLPFDASEEQLYDIFATAGPVMSVK